MSDQSNIFERGFADAAGLTDPTRDNEAIDATMFELYKAGAVGSTTSKLKMYVGGVWVAKPLKKYVGGMWVEYPLKYLGGGINVGIKILRSQDGNPLRSADGKVLIIGDWPPDIYSPEYGLLYNWYAATDSRKISSSDDWIVPTSTNYTSLETYLTSQGYSGLDGKVLKEVGDTYWFPLPLESTNIYGFNWRGSGYRNSAGFFQNIGLNGRLWTSSQQSTTDAYMYQASKTSNNANVTYESKKIAHGIRLLYVGSGTPTEYVGNDGRVYRIVTIGTQTWLADNLCETKFRNGDVIPWYGADPVNFFTNAEWAALTTPGVCAYDNMLSNVGPGFSFPS